MTPALRVQALKKTPFGRPLKARNICNGKLLLAGGYARNLGGYDGQ
jgi:hypothetical protein